MSANGEPGFSVTQSRVSFALALVAVLGVMWGGFNMIKSGEIKDLEQDMRLERSDRDRERFNSNIKDLTEKTGKLNESIIRLTAVLEQDRTRNRASLDLDVPIPYASPALALK